MVGRSGVENAYCFRWLRNCSRRSTKPPTAELLPRSLGSILQAFRRMEWQRA